MICGGGTMLRAATACREHGAAAVHAVATHALFSEGETGILSGDIFDSVIVTDSVSRMNAPKGASAEKLRVVSVAPLLAETVKRLHDGGSIGALLEDQDASI